MSAIFVHARYLMWGFITIGIANLIMAFLCWIIGYRGIN